MAALNASGRTVTLKGGPVTLVFTTDRLIEVENRFGSIAAAERVITDKPTTAARYFLWIGSGRQVGTGAEIPESEVGPLMDGTRTPRILNAVTEAINDALRDDEPPTESGPTTEATAATPGPTS